MITRSIRPTGLSLAVVVGLVVSAFAAATAVAVSTGTRQVPSGGTTTIRASAIGADEIQQPEIREGSEEDEGASVGHVGMYRWSDAAPSSPKSARAGLVATSRAASGRRGA